MLEHDDPAIALAGLHRECRTQPGPHTSMFMKTHNSKTLQAPQMSITGEKVKTLASNAIIIFSREKELHLYQNMATFLSRTLRDNEQSPEKYILLSF